MISESAVGIIPEYGVPIHLAPDVVGRIIRVNLAAKNWKIRFNFCRYEFSEGSEKSTTCYPEKVSRCSGKASGKLANSLLFINLPLDESRHWHHVMNYQTTLKYHIALSRPFDLDGIEQEAAEDKKPRHILWTLQQRLDAKVHQPDSCAVTVQDKLFAKLIGQPEHWAMARQMTTKLTANDVVFCVGEDIGFPLALLVAQKRLGTKVVVSVMAPNRLRVRGVLKLFNLQKTIPLFFVNTKLKAQSLREWLSVPDDRVRILPEQTDVRFFNPGEPTRQAGKPILAGGGMEQRDYTTLAEATKTMDVDVRISAVSPNASANTSVSFPDPVPGNMQIDRYEWQELRQLYRDASVVVVSLLPNDYSAGLTTMVEAMACRRPVIISRTPGLAEELIDQGLVVGVPPLDSDALRLAIKTLLNDPEYAEKMAQRGYDAVMANFTSERHVQYLANHIKQLNTQRVAVQQSA